MIFEAFAARIMSLNEFIHPKSKKITQNRFQIKNTEMRLQSMPKTQFAGLNDKRFYFYDSIVSLPFGHPLLEDLRKEKRKKHISSLHIRKKEEYLKAEALTARKCETLRILRSILLTSSILYKLDSILFCKSLTKLPTKDYVLNSHWL